MAPLLYLQHQSLNGIEAILCALYQCVFVLTLRCAAAQLQHQLWMVVRSTQPILIWPGILVPCVVLFCMHTMPHWAGCAWVVCTNSTLSYMLDAGMDSLVDCAGLAVAILSVLCRLHPAFIIWR